MQTPSPRRLTTRWPRTATTKSRKPPSANPICAPPPNDRQTKCGRPQGHAKIACHLGAFGRYPEKNCLRQLATCHLRCRRRALAPLRETRPHSPTNKKRTRLALRGCQPGPPVIGRAVSQVTHDSCRRSLDKHQCGVRRALPTTLPGRESLQFP
jgi:hypothetical protein